MTATNPLPRSLGARVWTLWGLCFACGLALLVALGTGCSGSGAGGDAALGEAKAALARFLDAVRRGDETAAAGMLSQTARTKTQELGISVAPPVNSTATCTVGDAELVGDTGALAHVGTVWSDTGADGLQTSESVLWALRRDPEGWRVVGMAMNVFDDLPPLLLNFEDPEDMLAKQELVAAELRKRSLEAAAKSESESRTARGDTPAVR
ncbi:MAG: hypothetical protein EBZ74_05215 [Planctomycetia bacterium]|nr:hypothetical protein [Planctomycetia bacterium]